MSWTKQDKMKIERQIDQIINTHLPNIASGKESLDSILARYPHLESELQPRLEAAIWLQKARFAVSTRPGYIHDSRIYLQNKTSSMRPNFWQRLAWRYTPQRWVFNIAATTIVLLLLVLVVNSAVLTARLSIPGDPLYSAKLVMEDMQLALTIDQLDRTNLLIQHSRERALEFVELVMEGEYEQLPASASRMEADIIAAIQALDNTAQQDPASEKSSITNLRDTLTNQIFMLNVLKSTTPPSAHTGIDLAIQVAQSGVLALR